MGELAVVLAPPHRGKTSLLCAAGAAAASKGRRVLHISLETHTHTVVRRYDQALTHLHRTALDANQDLIATARRLMTERGGRVTIKDWSHARVTPSAVEAAARRQGHLDLLILDYLGLAYPDAAMHRSEVRHVYGALCREMRAMASRLKVPLLTAWQVNRAGHDSDILRLTDVAESWEMVQDADTIIALNRNDAEKVCHRARLALLKNREDEGVAAPCNIYCDFGRMIVRDVRVEDHARELEATIHAAT